MPLKNNYRLFPHPLQPRPHPNEKKYNCNPTHKKDFYLTPSFRARTKKEPGAAVCNTLRHGGELARKLSCAKFETGRSGESDRPVSFFVRTRFEKRGRGWTSCGEIKIAVIPIPLLRERNPERAQNA
jgi:ribosomal protein L34E